MKNALFVAACLALAAVAGVKAADQAPAQPAPDRRQMIEMHEKMADLHKKAAECLKAGKDVKVCHDEMVKECPMSKTGSCPFMGEMCPMCGRGMGPGRGMGRGRGMRRGMGPMGPGAAPAAPAPAASDQKPAGQSK